MEIIWKTIVGSKLYGLDTPESDTDYKGVFLPNKTDAYPNKDQIIGLKDFKHVEKQDIKGEDDEEGILFSARYFLQLYLKGNPTLAEVPFASPEFVVEKTVMGETFMKFIRENLVTRHLFGGYMGFFNDQVKAFNTGKGKSREKRLKKGSKLPEGYNIPKNLIEEFVNDDFETDWGDGNKSSKSKDIVSKIRNILISQGWYDGKMMSHAYRIGVQGVELFKTGYMHVTLQGEELDIAKRLKTLGDKSINTPGRISRQDAIDMVTKCGKDLEDAKNSSPLDHSPNEQLVNEFLINFLEQYYGTYHV